MVRWFLAVALAVVSFASTAKAICHECPFPMAALYGSWESTTEQDLTLIVSEKGYRNGYVTVQVVIWDNINRRAIGHGEATADKDDTAVRVQIKYQNGVTKSYVLGLDPTGTQVFMDRGHHSFEDSCDVNDGCFRFVKSVRGYSHSTRTTHPKSKLHK